MKRVLLFLSLISLPFSMISNVKAANYASDTLKGKVVTSGDGLYVDSTADGRYVYKGANPNNFIKFNDELWRIMSVEKDGKLKIIRANVLDENLPFNESSLDKGSYCSKLRDDGFGCNAWAKMDYFKDGHKMDYNQNKYVDYEGSVNMDSTLNTYLNNDYYSGLNQISKNMIVNYDFGIGSYDDDYYKDIDKDKKFLDTMNKYKTSENEYIWNGKIALANVSDVILANIDYNKCGTIVDINNNYFLKDNSSSCHAFDAFLDKCYNKCADTNWLMPSKKYKFTNYSYLLLNSNGNDTWHGGYIYAAAYQGIYDQDVRELYSSRYNNTFTIRPVTHLRSDMEITTGDGSEANPYEFKCDECSSTKNNDSNDSNLVVEVPSTSMFISIFIIGGFILIMVICLCIYLKVFKKKDINK